MPWSDGIIDSVAMNLSKLRERLKDREAWHAAVHGIAESDTTEQQQIVLLSSHSGKRNSSVSASSYKVMNPIMGASLS